MTRPVRQRYCQRHRYQFLEKRWGFKQFSWRCGTHHFLAFERWRWFAEELETCDAILAIGADVLITNHRTTIEGMLADKKAFLCAKDAFSMSSDVLLVHNTPRTLGLMRRVASLQKEFENTPDTMLDQAAFESLVPSYSDVVQFLPQRQLNAYDYPFYRHLGGRYAQAVDVDGNDGQWQQGDFLLHVPGLPKPQKIQILQNHLGMIIE